MRAEVSVAVRITDEGMIPIPRELRQALGLKPAQVVQLHQENDNLVVRRFSPHEPGEQIVALLKQALADTR